MSDVSLCDCSVICQTVVYYGNGFRVDQLDSLSVLFIFIAKSSGDIILYIHLL